jgi:undecaprenyl-diphosphatase
MTWWEALILGVVQGVTEFFPVSSSGHLVMAGELLGLSMPGITFEVMLHLATLVSVLIVYRAKLASLVTGVLGGGDRGAWSYVLKLALASVPAALAGLLLKDFFEARFADPVFAGTMVLVTGTFVWTVRWARGTSAFGALEAVPLLVAAAVAALAGTIVPFLAVLGALALIFATARATAPREWHPEPTWTGALLMGVAQSLAILPGISRSGSTVLTGLWRRIDPVAAAEFSFLMSIPAILGAGLLEVPDLLRAEEPLQLAPLLIGGVAAMISGILAIRFFVLLLRRQNFWVFSIYCWIAGSLFLLTR